MLKICADCSIEKPLNDFYPRGDKKGTDVQHICKRCVVNRNRVKRLKSPEKYKNYDLFRSFGITLDQYNEMFHSQGGKCKICGKHQSELRRSLAVDHNHVTGLIRGLLCEGCNKGLGQFRDSVENLKKAINYLNDLASHKTKVDGKIYYLKNGG